jgi:hypothetical protein
VFIKRHISERLSEAVSRNSSVNLRAWMNRFSLSYLLFLGYSYCESFNRGERTESSTRKKQLVKIYSYISSTRVRHCRFHPGNRDDQEKKKVIRNAHKR